MLFRTEATEHFQRDATQGQILLRSPAILWGCSIAVLFLSAAIIALLFQASHIQKLKMPGLVVSNGDAAGNGAPRLQIFVPSNALPVLRVGRQLPVHYPAFAREGQYPYFASIKDVSRVPVKSTDEEPRFRVMLQPEKTVADADGLICHLTVGMAIEAEIALEKTRLLEWIVQSMRATEKEK